jgi:hypothetical protein
VVEATTGAGAGGTARTTAAVLCRTEGDPAVAGTAQTVGQVGPVGSATPRRCATCRPYS